ncbi:reverse transcriptase [Gossypium australe]|uniref:Reverse transcriptase n=1 Tax=Gossypium australe TaxID=47621 RepID=A0A5B6WEG7_9ROSI|nr:reverse transcriptase [Gossypium australe]
MGSTNILVMFVYGYPDKQKRKVLWDRLDQVYGHIDRIWSRYLLNLEIELRVEYEKVLDEEELLWKQNLRLGWIQFGDRNKKFSHNKALVTQNSNKNSALKFGDCWCYDNEVLIPKMFLVLIPKIKNPKSLSHYRPISLGNVLYKIVTKVIANRLKPIFHSLIVQNQVSFVAWRQIKDNNIIAQDIVHLMRTKKREENLDGYKSGPGESIR